MAEVLAQRYRSTVRLDKLTPHPENAREGDTTQIQDLIEANGFYGALLVQASTGYIVVGNHRYKAARAAGIEALPVFYADLDDERALRILIGDNRANDLAGWDREALAAQLRTLEVTPAGLAGTGFTDARQLAALAAGEDLHPGPLESEYPVRPDVAVSKPGDLWLLGPHRLVVGDCTEQRTIDALFAGERAHVLLTDPPYCSGGFQEAGRASGSIGTTRTKDGQRRSELMPTIANDTLSTRGYQALIKAMLSLAPVDLAYVFTDWRMWVNLFDLVESCGFGVRNMIVWNKGTPGMGRDWRSQHELIMWAVRAKVDLDKHLARGNVVDCRRSGNPLHPTQKPVPLLRELLAVLAGTEVSRVYDPFAGSGSTMVAASRVDMTAYMTESDPRFADVICRRWLQLSGEKPVHAASGNPAGFDHVQTVPAEVED